MSQDETNDGGGGGSAEAQAFTSVHDLVHYALASQPNKRAGLRQIYATCKEKGRIASKHGGGCRLLTANEHWKSQIRHALYTSPRFKRAGDGTDEWAPTSPDAPTPRTKTVRIDAGAATATATGTGTGAGGATPSGGSDHSNAGGGGGGGGTSRRATGAKTTAKAKKASRSPPKATAKGKEKASEETSSGDARGGGRKRARAESLAAKTTPEQSVTETTTSLPSARDPASVMSPSKPPSRTPLAEVKSAAAKRSPSLRGQTPPLLVSRSGSPTHDSLPAATFKVMVGNIAVTPKARDPTHRRKHRPARAAT